MANANTNLKFTILLHQEESAWFAQCLEYDVAAQAPNPGECKRRILHSLSSRILLDLSSKVDPLSSLGPAPHRYFEMAVNAGKEDPELPVYVPAAAGLQHKLQATARFIREENVGAARL